MKFFTFPPNGIKWDYLFVNPKTYRYLFKRSFKHAILDSGVEYFKFNPNVKEYPSGFLNKWKNLAIYLSSIFKDKLWITIPDYPDDFNPGQFGDNVTKTIKNIEEFIKIKDVNWLPVVQSKFLDKFSYLHSLQKAKQIIGDYPQIAIGTVCKTNNLEFIEYCCKATRKYFKHSKIHAFGLTLSALPKVKQYIDSFDSTAYTFPRKSINKNWSAKTKEERKEYFIKYVERVNEIVKK